MVHMKILIAADLHWPTINGVATFSRNLAQSLADRGHEVLVIAPSQTGKKYEEYDRNHIVKRTASVPFPFYQNFKISLTPQIEVKKIIEEFQPDVIHIQMLLSIGQAAMRYGKKMNIPIVSTNHAIPENLLDNLRMIAPLARPINYMIKVYGRRFYIKSDYVTTPTQSAIDMFVDIAEQLPAPIEPVSNGIDLSRFKPGSVSEHVMKKFNIPESAPIVTYIGRLDAEKRLSVLVRAFSQIQTETGAHLLMVGDGTDAAMLRRMVKDLNIETHVSFTGRVSDEEIIELHRAGTLYAITSPAELQSIATLEAMASGQPIVAVDAGALGELCHDGVNGFLTELDNDKQVAESIKKIITDAELRDKFSRASLEIAREHDIEHTLDRFEQIYRDVIDLKKSELA